MCDMRVLTGQRPRAMVPPCDFWRFQHERAHPHPGRHGPRVGWRAGGGPGRPATTGSLRGPLAGSESPRPVPPPPRTALSHAPWIPPSAVPPMGCPAASGGPAGSSQGQTRATPRTGLAVADPAPRRRIRPQPGFRLESPEIGLWPPSHYPDRGGALDAALPERP